MEAEELGWLFFTEDEILVILTESPESYQTAILKGRLQKDAAIRKMVVEQAIAGSDQAQKQVELWKMRIAIEAAR